jgi:hypothetical protein
MAVVDSAAEAVADTVAAEAEIATKTPKKHDL